MQKSDMSLTPIPGQSVKESGSERVKPVSDKNRVDTIARTSEPGRKGEESFYVPPSHLHPERSTAQSAFENPLTASSGGGYGLDHFLDKGSVGESAAGSPVDERSALKQPTQGSNMMSGAQRASQRMKGRSDQFDRALHRKPLPYMLGALGAGFLVGRMLRPSSH
jgi:hypothetical protein